MESGLIELSKLYEHLESDLEGESLYGNSPKGREYGKIAKDICHSVKDKQGFYLWGKYEDNGLWRNIYLGKAGNKMSTSLHNRILEQLRDDKVFIWNSKINKEDLLSIGKQIYPNKWSDYKKDWERAMKKTGTTHIIWVATPDMDNNYVNRIEADLIETINPIANVQRPKPESELQEYTIKVISKFKHHIHNNRNNAFRLE